MPKLSRNALILAKIQPTLDTDPIPTAALNSILAGNVTINAIQAEFADRANIQPYFGNSGKVLTSQYSSISFDVELQGAGAAGTAPKYGPLLRACALSETISAGVSVIYQAITNAMEMVAIHFYLDGLKFVLLNSKGTVAYKLDARGIPMMSFTFTGSFSQPTDTAIPTGSDFSGFKAPLAINKINTPTFTLHSVAVKAQSLGIDLKNNVVYRNLIGSETIAITDREPDGSVAFETDTIASKDWYSIIKLGTLGPMQLIHGSVAGSIVQIDAPKVQLLDPKFSDTDGVSILTLGLSLQPNVGNDEFVLTIK
jgi:hypothetical protein